LSSVVPNIPPDVIEANSGLIYGVAAVSGSILVVVLASNIFCMIRHPMKASLVDGEARAKEHVDMVMNTCRIAGPLLIDGSVVGFCKDQFIHCADLIANWRVTKATVGKPALNAELVKLDGSSCDLFSLLPTASGRPLVITFGSYT